RGARRCGRCRVRARNGGGPLLRRRARLAQPGVARVRRRRAARGAPGSVKEIEGRDTHFLMRTARFKVLTLGALALFWGAVGCGSEADTSGSAGAGGGAGTTGQSGGAGNGGGGAAGSQGPGTGGGGTAGGAGGGGAGGGGR